MRFALYGAFNETDEARFVVDRIRDWSTQGNGYSEAAILYRSNAQSRLFEESLISAGVPYRVYGGLRFFERAEIKDALAYLRLVANRDDDPSFERVVNTPTRGIGGRTVDLIRDRARAEGVSLWRAAQGLCASAGLPARAAQAVQRFVDLVERLAEQSDGTELFARVEAVISASELIRHYEKEGAERAQIRRENLDELVNAARQFEAETDAELEVLDAFLARAALEAGEAQGEAETDCVQLMTLHSAKGLEFPLVFLSGLEEGLFPHQRFRRRTGASGRRASAVLRRHDACHAAALPDLRRVTPVART